MGQNTTKVLGQNNLPIFWWWARWPHTTSNGLDWSTLRWWYCHHLTCKDVYLHSNPTTWHYHPMKETKVLLTDRPIEKSCKGWQVDNAKSKAHLSSRGTQWSIRRHSDAVKITSMADMVGFETTVGQVPHLHQLVPTTRHNDGVWGVGWETDATNPFTMPFIL